MRLSEAAEAIVAEDRLQRDLDEAPRRRAEKILESIASNIDLDWVRTIETGPSYFVVEAPGIEVRATAEADGSVKLSNGKTSIIAMDHEGAMKALARLLKKQ